MKIAERINLESLQEKMQLCMVTNVNETYCGDNSTMCTSIEPLCCTPETNVIVYDNHTSIKIFLKVEASNESNLGLKFS